MTTANLSAAGRTLNTARLRKRHADARTPDIFTGEFTPAPPVATPSATTKRTPRRRGHPQPDGAALRDAGIAAASGNAGAKWHLQALELVRIYAGTRETLTCDSARLWAEATGFERAPDARAWGAVMLEAKRKGFVEATATFVPSDDPACHHSPVRVWRSLVCKPPGSTL